jgi:hypothetical protein
MVKVSDAEVHIGLFIEALSFEIYSIIFFNVAAELVAGTRKAS